MILHGNSENLSARTGFFPVDEVRYYRKFGGYTDGRTAAGLRTKPWGNLWGQNRVRVHSHSASSGVVILEVCFVAFYSVTLLCREKYRKGAFLCAES